MKNYYVMIYFPADSGESGSQVRAKDSTAAIWAALEKIYPGDTSFAQEDFEVIAVIEGRPRFATVDETKFNLFPGI